MNRHVFLNNDKSDNPKFNRQRNVGGSKKAGEDSSDEPEINGPKIIPDFQKDRLRTSNVFLIAVIIL